ncbi:MAG: Ig-like domain-containing protein, partial [Chloroflexota bacterium]
DPPTATADSFTALAGRTLNVAAPGVLLNDHDPEGDTLTASVVTGVSHGTLVLASNGAFSYTPAGGFHGGDGFSYRASDGTATSPTRVVTLSVVAIPTPAPTLAPTDTPMPTVEPSPEPTPEPTPSTATEAPPSLDPGTPTDTLASTARQSALPGSTPAPEPTAGSGGGPSLPLLLVIVLLGVLLAFGAAIYVPRWLGTVRTGEPPDDDA